MSDNQIEVTAPSTEGKEFAFRFKKDDLGNKRSDVKVTLQVPSFNGLVEILQNAEGSHKKEFELLQEAVADYIASAARAVVNNDDKITGNDNFPHDQVTWTAIANQSKADRRSNTIPEDDWKAFANEYIEIMPGITGKTKEAVTNATIVYLKKFSVVKTDKAVLSKLQSQLALFAEHSKNVEQFADILELLNKRLETYLGADDIKQLVENL